MLPAIGLCRLALVAPALLVAGCGGGDEPPTLPLGRQIAATATLSPTVHVFAEDVVARVDVVVDRDRVDPERVRLETRFLPYEVTDTDEEREDRGRFTLLRYEYLLRCLGIDCIPEVLPSAAGEAESGRGERRSFRLPAVRVVHGAEGETRTLTTASWPELVSVSRLKQSDVPRFGLVFKANVNPLPEPDYRVEPRVLGAGLAVGALALLALPATFLIGRLRRRPPPEPEPEEPELPPLERALRLVETRADRREALEVLAGELDAASHPELATSARTLAWSRAAPTREAADRLVQAVRNADAGD